MFLIRLKNLRAVPCRNFCILDHSTIFTLWTIPELFNSGPFQKCYSPYTSSIYTLWPFHLFKMIFFNTKKLCILDNLEFRTLVPSYILIIIYNSRIPISGQFQNSQVLDLLRFFSSFLNHSRTFTLQTIKEFPNSWQFQNLFTLDHSGIIFFPDHLRISKFLTNPEFLHSWSFQKYRNLYISRVLHSGPFQNFYVTVCSKISTFLTIPELLHSGIFDTFYAMENPNT